MTPPCLHCGEPLEQHETLGANRQCHDGESYSPTCLHLIGRIIDHAPDWKWIRLGPGHGMVEPGATLRVRRHTEVDWRSGNVPVLSQDEDRIYAAGMLWWEAIPDIADMDYVYFIGGQGHVSGHLFDCTLICQHCGAPFEQHVVQGTHRRCRDGEHIFNSSPDCPPICYRPDAFDFLTSHPDTPPRELAELWIQHVTRKTP